MAIDMGPDCIDRAATSGAQTTLIAEENPANGTGTITDVEIWASSDSAEDLSLTEVATFQNVGGNDFTTRDSEVIGTVTKGSKQTFSGLDMDVVTGDYIGIKFYNGAMERDLAGDGYWYLDGDFIPCAAETFSFATPRTISLYAFGTEAGELISFSFDSRLDNMDALQGVASDGIYLYNTGATDTHDDYHIYKRNKNGTLVTSNDHPETDGTDCSQVNGIFVEGDKLYVGAANGGLGFIKVFETSDLSYVEEHQVTNHFCEGAVHHNGFWWVFYDDWNYISKYNESWVWQADYVLAFGTLATRVNGMLWVGDYVYLNNHENATRDTLDCYHWTGAAFDYVGSLARPTSECTQGFYKEPGANFLWWAERHYDGGVPTAPHNIVKTTLSGGGTETAGEKSANIAAKMMVARAI